MKQLYKITVLKKGVEEISFKEMESYEIDEMHLVSLSKSRHETQREMNKIFHENSFRIKHLPILCLTSSIFLMAIIILQSWNIL